MGGSDGSHGPRPWKQRQAHTIFLRVPTADWVEVSRGMKREFTAADGACSALWNLQPPTPVVAYRYHKALGYESELMVLEAKWQEPLGAISPESLENEGFTTLAEFRKYWCGRERRRFAPMKMVTRYRVRPWGYSDTEEMAKVLLDRLYGQWL
jgi:hypothetical protein